MMGGKGRSWGLDHSKSWAYRCTAIEVHSQGLVTGGALGLALSPIHVFHHACSAEDVSAV